MKTNINCLFNATSILDNIRVWFGAEKKEVIIIHNKLEIHEIVGIFYF